MTLPPQLVRRGEVWWASGDPVKGHEQGGSRPWLVVSSNLLNRTGLIMGVPVTSKRLSRSVPLHVRLEPPEAGLTVSSLLLCDQMRALDVTRLQSLIGTVDRSTMESVEKVLRRLLEL